MDETVAERYWGALPILTQGEYLISREDKNHYNRWDTV